MRNFHHSDGMRHTPNEVCECWVNKLNVQTVAKITLGEPLNSDEKSAKSPCFGLRAVLNCAFQQWQKNK